ncbi:MAG: hypothetical protein HY321_21720 [Armatimonadetes bacterium]|nr:hypothetical protein [Armatimonadota bacterium]
MPSYEEIKLDLSRFLASQHNATLAAFGAADKEDKDLGPVRDFRLTFRIAERANFDAVHASLRRYLTDNVESAFLTAFSAAEKDDKEGGRLREFRTCIRVPLLARAKEAGAGDGE